VKHWHDMIANPTVADAILDRQADNLLVLRRVQESAGSYSECADAALDQCCECCLDLAW
jgi:hypothetical protein